jgi:NitT/TauT family transport system permease protein
MTDTRTRTPTDPVAEPRAARSARARRRKAATWPYRVAAYVVVLGAWQLLSGRVFDEFKLPSPTTILATMWEIASTGELWYHASATLRTVFISLGFIFVIGGVLGLLMGLSQWWEDALRDLVSLLISVPGLIFVLLFLIIFGLSPVGAIVAIVVTNFAFVTVQTWEGIRAIPGELTAMGRAFAVPKPRVLRQVVVPALAPFLFTALTYSFALTWKLTMLSELFGSRRGVGFKIRVEFAQFDVAGMLAWAMSFYIFALVLERFVFQRLSARFFRWRAST